MKSGISSYTTAWALSLCLIPAMVHGQEELDSLHIKVVGAYDPTIADAFKIADFPKINEAAPSKPSLNYGIASDKFTSNFEVEPVKPARIKGEHLKKLYRGYVKIAGGSPGILAADAFYNSLRSKKNSWGVRVNHFSTSGKIPDVGNSDLSETAVNLYGKKFVKKHSLSGGLNLNLSHFHYYGFDTTDAAIASLDDTIIGEDATLQKFNTMGGYVRLLSHHKDSNALNYDVRLNYYNFVDNYLTMENNFNTSVDFTRYLEKEFIHIHFKFDYNDDRFYKGTDSARTLANTVLTLRPQITTGGTKYKFTVGINTVLDVIGDLTASGRIFPSLYFSYNLVKDIMIPYIGIGGGMKRNSLQVLSNENPYILTDLRIKKRKISVHNTVNAIKFYGGVKGEFNASSSFNISVTRDKLDDQYFFVNDTSGALGNKFGVVYDNVALLQLRGEMSYDIREKIKLMLVGEINEYKMDLQERPWHVPAYHISFMGSYNLQEKIIAKLDLFAIGDQYIREYDTAGSPVAIKLAGVVDLNLELEYRYTRKLSAYLKLNNLTAQRYNRWNGYPTMRFNFLGGLTYIF